MAKNRIIELLISQWDERVKSTEKEKDRFFNIDQVKYRQLNKREGQLREHIHYLEQLIM